MDDLGNTMTITAERVAIVTHLPAWVPDAARNYLAHTETGLSIRALARASDCHASTILRQVRRFENRRDDPLIDDALRRLAGHVPARSSASDGETAFMNVELRNDPNPHSDGLTEDHITSEANRILRRLCETGAVLAVARDMEMAVVVRDDPIGGTTRTAITERAVAQAFALRDWISCDDPEARIVRYRITNSGRAAIRQIAETTCFAEQQSAFITAAEDPLLDDLRLANRVSIAESPLIGLSRRRGKDGQPFLTRDLVTAGERLREDFELANIAAPSRMDWSALILNSDEVEGPTDGAGQWVLSALRDLGPGLGDVALRCCCYLEGLEAAERKMGWAARSGKIVLRIALQRLKRHYDEQGQYAPKIG
jgi:hypothetical protein